MRELLFRLFRRLFPKGKKIRLVREMAGRTPYFRAIYGLLVVINNFIYSRLSPRGVILIEAQESRMYVDVDARGIAPMLLLEGIWEKYETELFKDAIKEGMVVVDIGANIGYYTLIAAKLVGESGMVYAFEPEPSNYDLLLKNIGLNGYTNIVPVQKALSNKQGEVELWFTPKDRGLSSFSRQNVSFYSRGETSPIEVEGITLDDFFESTVKNDKVDVIKLDAEGAEGLIIGGAERIFKNNNLKIFMEFGPYLLRSMGTDPLDLLYKLKDYGFKIKLLNEERKELKEVETGFFEQARTGKVFNLLLEK